MLKRVFVLTVLCLLLIPATAAYADVIAEPDNNFFNRHRNDCVYLGRSFCKAGEDGAAPVKKAPNSNENIAFITSTEIIFVEFSCLYKGNFWGLTQGYNGWVKLDEFLVLYDYISFEEEHSNDFYAYTGDYGEITKNKTAEAWPWPGADSPLWTIEDFDITHFSLLHAYKDEQGREWGFVSYVHGNPNIWLCLSDPLNKNMSAFNPAPEPTIWESKTMHNDIGKSDNPELVIIIILVASLVVGTIILIKKFWKPVANKQGE
jgi:hypothetical protein